MKQNRIFKCIPLYTKIVYQCTVLTDAILQYCVRKYAPWYCARRWQISERTMCFKSNANKYEQSSFSNLYVTSPTSQLILQPFRRFTYVTAYSLTLPLLHLRHSSFSNPSFASPTSQALHLSHLASRPCSAGSLVVSVTQSVGSITKLSKLGCSSFRTR